MKSALPAALLVLTLMSYATPVSSGGMTASSSASGSGTISLGDGLQSEFAFEAVMHDDGTATGRFTLSDRAPLPNQDVDGTDEPDLEPVPTGLEVTAAVDSIKVEGNRAVMSGTVTSTSHPRYAGLRVLLAVEDNGAGAKAAGPDKITWGIYPKAVGLVATDAENPDAGMYPVAEREVDAERFPLSSYSLSEIAGGDIQVRP